METSVKGEHACSPFPKYRKENCQEKSWLRRKAMRLFKLKIKNYTNFLLGVMLYDIVACINGGKNS